VFAVILLSGDPARAGADRARPEVACPERQNLEPIAKLACVYRLVSTRLITLLALTIIPKGRTRVCQANPIARLAMNPPRLEIELDGTMRPSWPSSSANFVERGRKGVWRQCGG
jgi:hypothetical protein